MEPTVLMLFWAIVIVSTRRHMELQNKTYPGTDHAVWRMKIYSKMQLKGIYFHAQKAAPRLHTPGTRVNKGWALISHFISSKRECSKKHPGVNTSYNITYQVSTIKCRSTQKPARTPSAGCQTQQIKCGEEENVCEIVDLLAKREIARFQQHSNNKYGYDIRHSGGQI